MKTDNNGFLVIRDPMIAYKLSSMNIPVFKQSFNGKEYFTVKDDDSVRRLIAASQSTFENLFIGTTRRLSF